MWTASRVEDDLDIGPRSVVGGRVLSSDESRGLVHELLHLDRNSVPPVLIALPAELPVQLTYRSSHQKDQFQILTWSQVNQVN